MPGACHLRALRDGTVPGYRQPFYGGGDAVSAMPPEIDRTHPGYLRHCVRPDCKAKFNILDAMDGHDAEAGWLIFRSVILGYICPAHAGPVADGSHLPKWGRNPDDDVVRSINCACGWSWSPPRMVAVQHEYQDQWLAHLIATSVGEYAQEVTELLGRLEEVDRQITPEHIAQQYRALEDQLTAERGEGL